MKFNYKNIIIIYFLLFGVLTGLKAQDQPGIREHADRYFKEFQYAKAASIYLQLTDKLNPYLHDMENLAICYSKMNKYEDAEIWYARVIAHSKSKNENLINYGKILKANSNYIKAKEIFQQYAKKSGDNKLLATEIASCDSAQAWLAHPANYEIINQEEINTDRAEFGAFPLPYDSLVYFVGEPNVKTSSQKYGWTGNSYLKIFTADIQNNKLKNPTQANLDINKSDFHVGPISTNSAGDISFITITYSGKDTKKIKSKGNTYLNYSLELYIQSKTYGEWKEPIAFAYNNPKNYSVGHATLSLDGKILYFVSDMPGGFGGTDIWYCELKKDGSWGKYINAGNLINTAGNEMFPFVDTQGNMFFSSDGLLGMGGLDIFKTRGEKANWSKPLNLQYPLNSPADDFTYWADKNQNKGYISSNRENGKGNDDIYAFTYIVKANKKYIVSGVAYDKKSKLELAETAVTLFDNNNNIVARQQSKSDGTFQFNLDKPGDYHLQGTKFSYYPDTATITGIGKNNDSIHTKLLLDPLFVKGKVFRLRDILYDFDKYNIRTDAKIILDELVQIMHENPTLKIELGSHTDSRGTTEYNQNLSQLRAQSVVDYVVSKGIARERMVAKGYGESKLLNKCSDGVNCSDEEHQQNRRTEFTVMEY